MTIPVSAIIGSIMAFWLSAKKVYDSLAKILTPLIAEVEQMAKDGLIDRADRKDIVMEAIKILEAQGKIKLNPLTRFLLSMAIDKIAKKLPDIKVSGVANEVIKIATATVTKK